MITDFATLHRVARSLPGERILALVSAEDETSLRVAVRARAEGLATSVLLGRAEEIRRGLETLGADVRDFEVRDCATEEEAAHAAAARAARGEVTTIVKGHASSDTVIRAVLDPAHGLRRSRVLSDVRLCDHPFLEGRFLGLTDGGVIPSPDVEQRLGMVANAVSVFHALGHGEPAVALLSASEKVTAAMPQSGIAREIRERWRRGEIPGCRVDGPLSFDLALVPEAAERKGYRSEVAGRAEVLVGPNIETINVLAKALVYLWGAVPGQVVVGARVPVLIPSRADSAAVKLNSIALAAVVG